MLFSRFLSCAAWCSTMAIASPVEAEETKLAKRQGTVTGILGPWLGKLINDAWTGPVPLCDGDFDQTYWMATWKVEETGQFVQVCWRNDTGLVVWDEPTVNVANCLTHLHYTQANTCISVKGSMCDNGYIDGGGRLQNLHTVIAASGNSEAARLTALESATIQAGIRALQGYNVMGTGHQGPFFYAVTSEDGDQFTSHAAQLQARFIGEYEC
ncbi:hypothetical protein NM208_g5075 [Fusarium decemcellulare]|uniref:Uncharacterized protein n=1 Tax=Fusarium decemcellulare TaxID=57161 RepID=A0ACC1SIM5_9HYPO|nr:hypothetical protein NM208_g5075 [Fusarium decemcellulare]